MVEAFFGALPHLAECPICASMALPEQPKTEGHWDYDGSTGPSFWAQVAQGSVLCASGQSQSPIDLTNATPASLEPLQIQYGTIPLHIQNNGHSINIPTEPGNNVVIRGQTYGLIGFHFHHPSEHTIEGQLSPMECHFVHRNQAGALAVLGVMLRSGRSNLNYAPIFMYMPPHKGPVLGVGGVIIDLNTLLPEDRSYWRYNGSLTTPPCSEGVIWTVFRQPVDISAMSIARFAQAFPINARPAQPLHGRQLQVSGGGL